jgi:hypothetical protein
MAEQYSGPSHHALRICVRHRDASLSKYQCQLIRTDALIVVNIKHPACEQTDGGGTPWCEAQGSEQVGGQVEMMRSYTVAHKSIYTVADEKGVVAQSVVATSRSVLGRSTAYTATVADAGTTLQPCDIYIAS